MSWFIGYSGENNPIIEDYISSLQLDKINEVRSKIFTLIWGGRNENLRCKFSSKTSGWVVSGIPISKKDSALNFMGVDELERVLEKKNLDFRDLDGHFTGVKWNEKEIVFFNDQLGLRDIYFLKIGSVYLFSTRADWTANFNRTNEINRDEFSTGWILTHKLTWQNVIKKIQQLGPSGRCSISSFQGSLLIENKPLIFSESTSTNDFTFIDHLKKFITLPLYQNKKVSLGLSGGLDSRVMLQVLLSSYLENWQTHTFGNNENYDCKIAQRISKDKEIKHQLLEIEFFQRDQLLKTFYEYGIQLGIMNLISDTLIYPLYKKISSSYNYIIDGAFGEIFRRAFLVRLSLTGKDEILKRNPLIFYQSLKYTRADIFNDDFIKQIEGIALNQIDKVLNIFPGPDDTGVENWLDNFLIVTKVPNVSCHSQTLLDTLCSAYMPFIQPSLLKLGSGLPLNRKRNGNLYRKIIKAGKQSLHKYPLVKDQIIYPFFLSTFSARVYTKLKRNLGFVYADNIKFKILNELKGFILDKISSAEVKDFSIYDKRKIEKIVFGFYQGEKSLADQILWWITFEIWRESFKIK